VEQHREQRIIPGRDTHSGLEQFEVPGEGASIGITPLRIAIVRHFTDGDHRNRRIAITENDRW